MVTWFVLCLSSIATAQFEGTEIEHPLKAFLHAVSPVANGEVSPGEYASSETLSFVDLENPGNPFPPLNQMCGAEDVECNDEMPADGDADLSATVHWGYTADAFFMAFDVTDQFIDADEGAEPFNNDGVELVIDPDADGADARNTSLEIMKLNVDTINDGFADGTGPVWVDSAPQAGEWTSGAKLTDKGYVVEYHIPLGSLDMESSDPPTLDASEAVPVRTGHTMRMNFAINDIDIEGVGQDVGTHAMWWVFEEEDGNRRSPWGGAEGNWVVGMELAGPGGVRGDYNANGRLDAGDLDLHVRFVTDGNPAGDVNGDGSTNAADRLAWVKTLQKSWLGDSNFDGEFNSGDFVKVFTDGRYETGQPAGYAEGDWDGNNLFNSGDFVAAFSDGGYEKGPLPAAVTAVPEPSSGLLMGLSFLALCRMRTTSTNW
jgi:hypothetical protein